MFNGIMEIRRSFNNKVVMTSREDKKLLKMHGSFVKSKNYAYLTHQ